ncbi:putative transcription factor interactor and regulator AUX-IAA family [Helianthus annuus]|uniref:Auxin-responsive protein n=1 Tax=Helianthus annuus TaxID=4232 RepID=A0A251UJB7_HELAN|nr:auxin-responsive protein IAA27 [Helianthus annuus]KAF5802802.1 putative transcription factor interactor and regulator AUX-IAA family [Helianthus annuus]KAJ0560878.1 putative transcription factor interactor and regulator AUX-IAA family [Helianthus annuus]KAJ0567339.1 putative transcription factor interactor and regulator AUX-IAA family [Helianthus annuus]KAJ0573918.1 putative transcription factor interactor and regulator AUX-IAA family [Helianthus annuus]KAJ0738252.1 putative transcription f
MSVSIKEHDYIGLSEANMEKQAYEMIYNNKDLNLKATELRLGLPGSESPEREVVVHGGAIKIMVAGAKRGFSDAINGGSRKWVYAGDGGQEVGLVKNSGQETDVSVSPEPALPEMKTQVSDKPIGQISSPAPKQQVVGWPPIRSFRKNTMAVSQTKNEEEGDQKMGSGCLYVKVSMDGAPYLRKVDLEIYSCYLDLSSALEKMFSCFTIGQYGSHGVRTREGLSESRLMDLLHGSEYVLTYEDKDGDWMLVGDVPWDMFIASCKRMRIMQSSDAIGLAPRAMEKCRNRTEPDNE